MIIAAVVVKILFAAVVLYCLISVIRLSREMKIIMAWKADYYKRKNRRDKAEANKAAEAKLHTPEQVRSAYEEAEESGI